LARSFRALRKSVINPHRPCPTLPLTGELGTTVCPISNTSGGLKTEKELSAEIFPANNEQNSQLIQHLFSCFKGTTTTAYPHNFKVVLGGAVNYTTISCGDFNSGQKQLNNGPKRKIQFSVRYGSDLKILRLTVFEP